MEELFGLVTGTVISMAIIPVMWRLAPRLGLIDEPDPRKVHRVAIPRVGGWGIVIGSLLSIVLLLSPDPLLKSYLLGSVVLFLFGLWDDAREIGHYKKFIGQIIAVSLLVFYGGLWIDRAPFLGFSTLPHGWGVALTFFAMIGMVNAINHSDGLDGLAGGESLLSLLAIGFLAYIVGGDMVVVIAATVIGGVLGFLRYNTHPARVFMGDTGSQFLGYTLGFLAVVLTQKVHTALSPAVTLLFLGLPVIDIIAVLTQRIYHRLNWFRATRNHIHHRLLDLGFDHYETVVIIYLIQTVFVISAVVLRYENDTLIAGLYLLACGLIFTTLIVLERCGWRAHRAEEKSKLSRFVESMKKPGLMAAPARLVSLAVPAYIVAASVSLSTVPRDFGIISAALFAVMAVEMVRRPERPTFLMRGVTYAAIVFAVFLFGEAEHAFSSWPKIEFAYFAILAMAIAFTVRYAADMKFRTTPMDYLIVLGVITILIFGNRYLQVKSVSLLIVKGIIMLYGCELIIEGTSGRWNLLSASTAVALGAFAFKALV